MTLKKMLDQKEKQAPAIDEDTISVLIDRINQVTQNSKALQVVDLIKKIDDKVIIFTEYRATQIYLQWFLQQNGISSVPFRGGFKRGKKDWMKIFSAEKSKSLLQLKQAVRELTCNFAIT